MKKTNRPKLALTHETLKRLSNVDLRRIVGGSAEDRLGAEATDSCTTTMGSICN
jgi:hypothetical protein